MFEFNKPVRVEENQDVYGPDETNYREWHHLAKSLEEPLFGRRRSRATRSLPRTPHTSTSRVYPPQPAPCTILSDRGSGCEVSCNDSIADRRMIATSNSELPHS